jgi:hypothetical protein
VKRGLLALMIVDTLVGFGALVAIVIYFLAHRDEEAEFILLAVLLVICCANAVLMAIFHLETHDQLQAHKEIREELARISGILERQVAGSTVGREGAQAPPQSYAPDSHG